MTKVRIAIAWVFALGICALAVTRGAHVIAIAAPLVALVATLWLLHKPLRVLRAQRRGLRESDRQTLQRGVAFYSSLDAIERERFERNVIAVAEGYHFAGVGVEVTDELKMLIAAGAAMVVHGRPDLRLQGTRDILIYPDAFSEDYVASHDANIAGMVHRQGPIIFSARSLRRGFSREADGHNVAVHEFAHVLDLDDGFADGAPVLSSHAVEPWLALVEDELRRVRDDDSVLRDYAGTNQAELFAVATEVFFERPARLKKRHAALYDALVSFYNVDPLALMEETSEPTKLTKKERRKRRNKRKRRRR